MGGEHVALDRLAPVVEREVLEIARRRPARIVDQDVRVGAGLQQGLAALLRRDVANDRRHLHAEGSELLGRGVEGIRTPGADGDIDAFAGERGRAALAQALRGRTNDSLLALDAQIHGTLSSPWRNCAPNMPALPTSIKHGRRAWPGP